MCTYFRFFLGRMHRDGEKGELVSGEMGESSLEYNTLWKMEEQKVIEVTRIEY